jgi:archaellum component FlaC
LRVVEAIKADGINNVKTMQSLDNTMKHLYSGLGKLDGSLQESVGRMGSSLQESVGRIDSSLQESVGRMDSSLHESVGRIDSSMQESVGKMSADLSKAMGSNIRLAADLAQAARAQNEINAEQHKKATESAKVLVSNMAGEMRSAMSVISNDIAKSISNSYKANAQIVDQLAARTQALVAEYDRYFSGIDQSTANVLNGMDSTISNTLIRLTDELSGVMDNFKESMQEGMERFESGTSKMIVTFEEQSRDLGLYARELNIDINTLSENLKDSVKIFNEGLNEGVQNTFSEFDMGLAQFTTRFANTLESIRDSVEALPSALRGR